MIELIIKLDEFVNSFTLLDKAILIIYWFVTIYFTFQNLYEAWNNRQD